MELKKALSSFAGEETLCGDYPFATEYKILFWEEETEVEIAENLAISTSVVSRIWQGILLGSPEV
ncbi:hypothetical protein [Planomicrobium sp. CPCC 101110]|uniref:hypothetical protein n=1 Tax=Planomicrobium sp. CPCC 101110 TaxID=2599619 RepID=UPI0011B450A0|nr:hypothetical protein [Planomicrobium sp. CPCC 101110]TWT25930.1 hypothetical protein FQV30_09050 [Planomicrobium sp. CPCC 101110]